MLSLRRYGLGKTLQAAAIIPSHDHRGATVIAAPTSLLDNWRSELARFRPELKVRIFHGSERQLDSKADVVITSHALLRLEIQRFHRLSWRLLICG